MLALSSATSFDGMYLSAKVDEPLLNAISTSEKKKICRHSRRESGRRLPRYSARPSSRTPAISERSDVNSKGGRSLTPTRPTRKLDPQTR